MTPDETTRIEFFRRQGIECHQPTEEEVKRGSYYQYNPDITRDTVHTALMGMSEEEWSLFGNLIYLEIKETAQFIVSFIVEVFKLELTTIVSCYLEATKGRINP